MAFSLVYHPEVKSRDLAKLNADVRQRIRKAIETRLLVSPQQYGKPLRKTLRGYWKLRVGDYRVVFKVNDNEILILGICHRKEIYPLMEPDSKTAVQKCPLGRRPPQNLLFSARLRV